MSGSGENLLVLATNLEISNEITVNAAGRSEGKTGIDRMSLIDEVKKRPCLWNGSRRTALKQKAWEDIVETLQFKSVDEAKNHWIAVQRKMRKLRARKANGSFLSGEETRFLNRISFVFSFLRNSLDFPEKEFVPPKAEMKPTNKGSSSSRVSLFNPFTNDLDKVAEQSESDAQDDVDIAFGQSVGLQLRELSGRVKDLARLQIQQILYKAKISTE